MPGIRAVIDTGVARISRYSHRSRLQRLPIEKISQASANQRSGRCGRVGPGRRDPPVFRRGFPRAAGVHRARDPAHEPRRGHPADARAEARRHRSVSVRRAARRPLRARWPAHAARARRACPTTDKLTDIGRRLAKLPLDPRLGPHPARRRARSIASRRSRSSRPRCRCPIRAIGRRTNRRRPTRNTRRCATSNRTSCRCSSCGRRGSRQREQLSRAKLRGWCKENFLSYLRLTEWHDVHGQVMEVVKGELALKLNPQAGRIRVHPPRVARRVAVAGGAAQGAGRVPGRQRHEAAHPSRLGAVQGAAGLDRERRAGADDEGVCAHRRARRTALGRSRSARTS